MKADNKSKIKRIWKKAVGVLVVLLFFLICFFLGYGAAGLLDSIGAGAFELILILLGIYLLYCVSIILHEGGHLIFGLLSGYGFSSFRIGSLMWIKQDGKIRLRRFSLSGTAGQCLMTPPKVNDGKIPVILYNLGGIIMNVILAVLLFGLSIILGGMPILSLILFIGALMSVIMALTNGIPLNAGGLANDGMNALHLSKNPDAALAFHKQLLMNEAQSRGLLTSEMPDEWFELPDGADMKNVHCASVKVFATGRALDELDTVRAEEDITALLGSDLAIIGLHRNLLTCDLILCRLLNHDDPDLSELLTPTLRKFMQSMKSYPSVLCTEYVIALLHKKKADEAEKIFAAFERAAKKHPYPQNVRVSRALMDRALKKYESLT